MKRILFLFMLPLFPLLVSGNLFPFKITGKISSGALDGQTVYLWEFRSTENMDSAIVKNGKFVIEGNSEVPKFAIITTKDQKYLVHVFVENAQIDVNIDLENTNRSKVSGSDLNNLFRTFADGLIPYYEMTVELQNMAETQKMTPELKTEITDKYNEITGKLLQYSTKFIVENPGTLMTALVLNDAIMQGLPIDEAQKAYDMLDSNVKNSGLGQTALQTLIKANVPDLSVEQKFRDLTMKNPANEDISISDYAGKGNYVLIMFWASWCTPCRLENPNIAALYEKYKKQGFEIVGVSLEKDRQQWIEAIREDSMVWPQMSDFQMWDSDAAIYYKIQELPFNVMLDKEGKIIAMNIRGNKLNEILEEIYKL
jgi:thiol-disulfide isomerase/thioredoxin